MRARVGLWLVAAATLSTVVFIVGARALSADAILSDGESAFPRGLVQPIDAALGLLLTVGVGVGAASTSNHRVRWWWWAAAAALALLPAVTIATMLGVELESFVTVGARTAGMLGVAAFGAGMRAGGGAKRLVWPIIVLGCSFGALSLFVPPRSPWLFASGIHVLLLFAALDLLGAFPPVDRAAAIPQARVAGSRVRTVAAASSLVLIAAGLLLGSLVVRGIAVSIQMNAEYLTGMTCGVAGLAGLWRLRGRRVFVSVVFGILFAGFGLLSEVVKLMQPSIDESQLTMFDAPAISIAVPAGASHRADHDGVNVLRLRPNHAELTDVVFAWDLESPPTVREDLDASSEDLQIGGGTIRRYVAKVDDIYYGSLVWSCDGARWMTVGFSAHHGRGSNQYRRAVERLLDRIAASITCR